MNAALEQELSKGKHVPILLLLQPGNEGAGVDAVCSVLGDDAAHGEIRDQVAELIGAALGKSGHNTEPFTDRMIRRAEVRRMLGIRAPSVLYDMIRLDGFPRPYLISKARKCWSLSECQAWLTERMAAQRSAAA